MFIQYKSYLSHRTIDSFPRPKKYPTIVNNCLYLLHKARANKTDFNFRILIFVENCLQYDTLHYISVKMSTGSYPADINRFRIRTENISYQFIVYKINVIDNNRFKIPCFTQEFDGLSVCLSVKLFKICLAYLG